MSRPTARRRLLATASAALAVAGVTLGVQAATSPASAWTGPTINVPVSIPADCSVDVTAQLQSFFNSVPDGDKIQFPTNGCYDVEGRTSNPADLNLTDRNNLMLAGAGSTFQMAITPPATPKLGHDMLLLQGDTNIRVYNLKFTSTNTGDIRNINYEWYSLIHVQGGSAIDVDTVTGLGAWGDFVNIGPDTRNEDGSGTGTGAVEPNGVTVENSNNTDAGRDQVSMTGGYNVTVNNNTFTNTWVNDLDIEVEAKAWHATNIAFTNNTVGGVEAGFLVADSGLGTAPETGITITGNTMTAFPTACDSPISVLKDGNGTGPKTNYTITGNSLQASTVPFSLHNLTTVNASSNTMTSYHNGLGCGNFGYGLTASGVHSGTVESNDFTGATAVLDPAAETAASIGTVCNNKITGSGGFNNPTTC